MTKTLIARVPYLNSRPFFRQLPLPDGFQVVELLPREQGEKAAAGEVMAGPLPLVDYLKLEDRFERLSHFGIAVRGRSRSALLFSRKPIRQLEGATIAVTEETSTTLALLRLILERRYQLAATYRRGKHDDADAVLLIGDEALRFRQTNQYYPFETDLAFEWWLWQHLPFVFAVWAIRKDCDPRVKQQLELALIKALAFNLSQLDRIAHESTEPLGIPEEELHVYLSNFVYRLGQSEERAIDQFKELVHAHQLL